MYTFLHSWRHRVGVTTLGLALLIGVIWGRSYFYEDHIWIAFSRRQAFAIHTNVDHIAISGEWQDENGRLSEAVGGNNELQIRFDPAKTFNWVVYPAVNELDYDSLGVTNWYWGWEHFGCGEWDDDNLGFRLLEVPYWAPVLSLALLAAYLILWRPRKRVDKPA